MSLCGNWALQTNNFDIKKYLYNYSTIVCKRETLYIESTAGNYSALSYHCFPFGLNEILLTIVKKKDII